MSEGKEEGKDALAELAEETDRQVAETDALEKSREESEDEETETKEDEALDKEDDQGSEDDKEDSKEKDGGEEETPDISDDLLERAVKAGLSLKAAKGVKDSDVLKTIVTAMESKGQGEQEEEKVETVAEVLQKLPEISDEDYPEEVVQTFGVLKDVILKQQAAIDSLLEGSKDTESAEDAEQKLNQAKGKASAEKSKSRSKRVSNQPRSTEGRFSKQGTEVSDNASDSEREDAAVRELQAMMDD